MCCNTELQITRLWSLFWIEWLYTHQRLSRDRSNIITWDEWTHINKYLQQYLNNRSCTFGWARATKVEKPGSIPGWIV